jgi:hypothetical protein
MFWHKAFPVQMLEMPFLEYKSLEVSQISNWLCFFKFRSYRLSIDEKVREIDNFENKNATKKFRGYDLLETKLATMVWCWTQRILEKKIKFFINIMFWSLAPFLFEIRP